MPLITCPDCAKDVSDAAPTCIHCGRPMRILPPPLPPASPADPEIVFCRTCGASLRRTAALCPFGHPHVPSLGRPAGAAVVQTSPECGKCRVPLRDHGIERTGGCAWGCLLLLGLGVLLPSVAFTAIPVLGALGVPGAILGLLIAVGAAIGLLTRRAVRNFRCPTCSAEYERKL